MTKIYEPEQADRIKERKERIKKVTYNKKAKARRGIEDYHHAKELAELELLENDWIEE